MNLRRWRKLAESSRRAQALVEFAMVILLIVTTMGGGVLVIRALFLQQSLTDIVARAAQWGAMTNNNDQIETILNEARGFSSDVQIKLTPSDVTQRKIGTKFTVEIIARVPMVGAGVALEAQLGARSTVLIEHDPMRFAIPPPPPFHFNYGDLVRVETTAGENLNVRRKPGLKGDPIFVMYRTEKATIIGGPVTLNGLRWWQVQRARSGQVGWCVDSADTVQTLVLEHGIF